MAAQQGKSVLGKYGAKLGAMVKAHANDETTYGIIQLPPGITNGVAQLTKCYFAEYKQGAQTGQAYFRAEGTIITPEYFDMPDGSRMKLAGLPTSIMRGICAQDPVTKRIDLDEESVSRVLNTMRQLGASTEGADEKDLEPIAAALQDAKPYFTFSTTPRTAQRDDPQKGVKKGDVTGVFENWHGSRGLEDYVPPSAGLDKIPDRTAPATSTNGSVNHDTTNRHAPQNDGGMTDEQIAAAEGVAPSSPGSDTGMAEQMGVTGEEIDALLEAAKKGDVPAQDRLIELAMAATGQDKETIEAMPDWEPIAEAARGEPKDVDQPEEKEFIPEKGTVYKFYPMVKTARGMTKAKTPSDFKCTAVNGTEKTCTLQSVADKKVIVKDVPWTDVIAE